MNTLPKTEQVPASELQVDDALAGGGVIVKVERDEEDRVVVWMDDWTTAVAYRAEALVGIRERE